MSGVSLYHNGFVLKNYKDQENAFNKWNFTEARNFDGIETDSFVFNKNTSFLFETEKHIVGSN